MFGNLIIRISQFSRSRTLYLIELWFRTNFNRMCRELKKKKKQMRDTRDALK